MEWNDLWEILIIHTIILVIYVGKNTEELQPNGAVDAGRVWSSEDSCKREMAIKPLNHQWEWAERRKTDIIGVPFYEEEECGTVTGE